MTDSLEFKHIKPACRSAQWKSWAQVEIFVKNSSHKPTIVKSHVTKTVVARTFAT